MVYYELDCLDNAKSGGLAQINQHFGVFLHTGAGPGTSEVRCRGGPEFNDSL